VTARFHRTYRRRGGDLASRGTRTQGERVRRIGMLMSAEVQ
jgi:hypothetical protein